MQARDYDVLDLLRVIKGAWIFVVVVPVLVALAVATIAYGSAREEAGLQRASAIVRFPADAFAPGIAEQFFVGNSDGEGSTTFLVENLADGLSAAYRTMRITITADGAVDPVRRLSESIASLSEMVGQYDDTHRAALAEVRRQHLLLAQYLDEISSDETSASNSVSDANRAANIIIAMNGLDQRLDRLEGQGIGPLQVLQPPEAIVTGRLSLLRFPIIGAIAALLGVLLVAFTIDSIRIAVARRKLGAG